MTLRPIIFDADSVRAILAGRKTQTRRVIRRVVVTVGGDATKLRNPYMVGDLLYVKEPWESWANTGRANGEAVDMMRPWRSPIFMPRACARMLLEIVSVRVERVQEIKCYEIRSEGISCPEHDSPSGFCCSECDALRAAFSARWNRKYAKRGCPWESNPWVWAIDFRPLNHSPSTAEAADGGAGAEHKGAPSCPVRQAGHPNTPTAADAAGD